MVRAVVVAASWEFEPYRPDAENRESIDGRIAAFTLSTRAEV